MKKSIICSFALAILVGAGLFTAKSLTASAGSDLLMANVEALAWNEDSPDPTCYYYTIPTNDDNYVLNCNRCAWERGIPDQQSPGQTICLIINGSGGN